MSKKRWLTGFALVSLSLVFSVCNAFAEGPSIKLGAMFISSGKVGGYGKHGRQAIQMAVDEINANGGILGRKMEAIVEDTKLKKEIAAALAEKFIKEDKVDFLMGPTSSGLAMTLTEIAKQNKKILIATQAAADELTGAKLHP